MCLIYGFYKPNYLLIFCFICKKNHLFFFIKKSHFELVRRSFKSTKKLDTTVFSIKNFLPYLNKTIFTVKIDKGDRNYLGQIQAQW